VIRRALIVVVVAMTYGVLLLIGVDSAAEQMMAAPVLTVVAASLIRAPVPRVGDAGVATASLRRVVAAVVTGLASLAAGLVLTATVSKEAGAIVAVIALGWLLFLAYGGWLLVPGGARHEPGQGR
jgi:hypothetical protein